MSIAKSCKITSVEAAAVAGTSDLTSDFVDMQGFESVTFIALLGTITSGAVTSLVGYTSASSDGSSPSAVTGATVTIADTDDGKCAVLTIEKPTARYVGVTLDRGTQNAVLDRIIAIQERAADMPTTHDATTVITPVVVTG